jgi:hypothetical protein
MDTRELNFVLKLLGYPGYRATISEVKPNIRTKSTDRDAICRQLCDRGLLDCTEEILSIKISPAGKALLKLDTTNLPVSKAELKVLHACAQASIPPSETGLKPKERHAVISGLVDRGLAIAEKTRVDEVWITEQGLDYLRDEYTPSGSALAISLDLLTNYLRFMRKSRGLTVSELTESRLAESEPVAIPPATVPVMPQTTTLTAADVFQTIQDLDRQLATDNYLPIYHLRQMLQPPLSREELDRVLYQLQREDKIELSSLQEAINYTPEQIDAGIAQEIGGPLFFIMQI